MDDDFATSHPSYSNTDFYIGATDNKGHGSKSYFNIPPNVKGEIAALVASRSIPVYRTEADFWRDAGVHRLHELSEQLVESAPVLSGRLEILARSLIVESDLEYEHRLIESEHRIYEHATYLMQHPPSMTTMRALHNAVVEISDPDVKGRLSRELEAYEARYRKD